jgi:hypothetical protein
MLPEGALAMMHDIIGFLLGVLLALTALLVGSCILLLARMLAGWIYEQFERQPNESARRLPTAGSWTGLQSPYERDPIDEQVADPHFWLKRESEFH